MTHPHAPLPGAPCRHQTVPLLRRDSAGSAYLTGWTGSAAFPTVNPLRPRAGGWEAFVARIEHTPTQPPPTQPPAYRFFIPILVK